MSRPNYKKMSEAELQQAFKEEQHYWSRLMKRESFSGLEIAGRLDEIQREMDNRGIKHKAHYTEINIEIGG